MTNMNSMQVQLNAVLPELIKDIRNGSSSAREEFAVYLLPFVKLIIDKYKATIDDDPESLAGLIITNLLINLDKIDLSKSVLGYISTTVNNKCIDLHRKTKRIATHYNPVSYDKQYLPAPDQGATNSEELQFWIDSNFSINDAEIINLYYIQNKSFDQIASITGQPVAEIKETISLVEN